MGAMKPNPCKWCGAKAKFRDGHNTYYCENQLCDYNGWELCQDFDTWQKNNPLPSAIIENEIGETHYAIPDKPHQFKVGDWVRVIKKDDRRYGKKLKVLNINENRVFVKFEDKNYYDIEDIEPATRLKRKEIRDRLIDGLVELLNCSQNGMTPYSRIEILIDKLIEEI